MKSDTTLSIESAKVDDLVNAKKFAEADAQISRILDQYNKLDYDLLLKRARIRQCQMKYEEALEDAKLAHNLQPQRREAYQVLADFLVAMNDHVSALAVLEVLRKQSENPIVQN